MSLREQVGKMGLQIKGGQTSYKAVSKFQLSKEDIKSVEYGVPYAGACTIDGVVVSYAGSKIGANDVVGVMQCIRPTTDVYNGKLYSLSSVDVKLSIVADNDNIPEWAEFADSDSYTTLKEQQETAAAKGWPRADANYRFDANNVLVMAEYELKDGKAKELVAATA